MGSLSQEFIRFAIDANVLLFGEFTTKAGRKSPYFFNAGLFNRGAMLGQLAGFYARTLIERQREQGIAVDMLFGPAYKGITLASATAVSAAALGIDLPFAYNRKEAKAHGEGGTVVGAPLQGAVVIIDDVISAGTSVKESVELIRAAGATPAAVLIALDRMERGGDATTLSASSAAQEVSQRYGIPVWSIATLDDLLSVLESDASHASLKRHREAVAAYRSHYGAAKSQPAA